MDDAEGDGGENAHSAEDRIGGDPSTRLTACPTLSPSTSKPFISKPSKEVSPTSGRDSASSRGKKGADNAKPLYNVPEPKILFGEGVNAVRQIEAKVSGVATSSPPMITRIDVDAVGNPSKRCLEEADEGNATEMTARKRGRTAEEVGIGLCVIQDSESDEFSTNKEEGEEHLPCLFTQGFELDL